MAGYKPEGYPSAAPYLITYRRAIEAGATSVQEPAQRQDEDRRGGVRDPAGVTWWIATQAG